MAQRPCKEKGRMPPGKTTVVESTPATHQPWLGWNGGQSQLGLRRSEHPPLPFGFSGHPPMGGQNSPPGPQKSWPSLLPCRPRVSIPEGLPTHPQGKMPSRPTQGHPNAHWMAQEPEAQGESTWPFTCSGAEGRVLGLSGAPQTPRKRRATADRSRCSRVHVGGHLLCA